jgi:uncharacterized protein involved in outer membrane biogenesis
VFRTIGAGDPIDGELDLVAEFSASGDNPRALIETLDGTLDMAMSRGHLHGTLIELWSEDLLSWLLSGDAIEGTTQVHCLVVRLNSRLGRARLTDFVLDTPDQRIGGIGVIDLAGERVDLVFVPRHKGDLLTRFTTPATLRGPLANPEFELNPAGLATDLVGRILFSPINALIEFLPNIGDSDRGDGHACLTR